MSISHHPGLCGDRCTICRTQPGDIRRTVTAGCVVEATTASTKPRTIYVHVDRDPWPTVNPNTTVLSDGTGVVAVLTNSIRVAASTFVLPLAATLGDPNLFQCGICGGTITAQPCRARREA